jgi:hypothetical protein
MDRFFAFLMHENVSGREGHAPQMMAALRRLAIPLMYRAGSFQIAVARRHVSSHPLDAWRLLFPQQGTPLRRMSIHEPWQSMWHLSHPVNIWCWRNRAM